VWLVLSGLVIAEAVNRTGLGRRIAARLFARFTGSYARLAVAVWGVATLLAFLMPATVARILLLVPIVYAAAESVGLARSSRGATGLVLVALLGSYQSGTAIIPANAPNLVLAGVAETLYGIELIYAKYLLLQFPVLAFAKGVVIIVLACRIFGEPVRAAAARVPLPPMSAEERRLALVLVLALAFWATDFLHGIKAGWVALAAAIVCLLPRVGMLPAAAFNEVRYSAVIYVAATIGMGAVSATSGLSDALGDLVLSVIPLEPGARDGGEHDCDQPRPAGAHGSARRQPRAGGGLADRGGADDDGGGIHHDDPALPGAARGRGPACGGHQRAQGAADRAAGSAGEHRRADPPQLPVVVADRLSAVSDAAALRLSSRNGLARTSGD
jgi:hypothetical protein